MFFSFAPEFHCFTAVDYPTAIHFWTWIPLNMSPKLMTSENVALFSQRCCMFWRNYFTHVCHHGMPYFQYNINIYIYVLHCIHQSFLIWNSNSVRLYLLRSFPRDAALFCASCSTRTHNILFREYHALWTTTIVYTKIRYCIHKRVLVWNGRSLLFKCYTCLFLHVSICSRSLYEQYWAPLKDIGWADACTSMYRCIPATSWNQEPRLQTTLLLLVLVVNARPHICWTMPHSSYIIFGILPQLVILRIVPVTLLYLNASISSMWLWFDMFFKTFYN